MFSPISAALPGLPPLPRTQAAWPCWSDSTRRTVRFTPLAKREAVKLFHKARRFERGTRQRGRQDGALGRNGLAVLPLFKPSMVSTPAAKARSAQSLAAV